MINDYKKKKKYVHIHREKGTELDRQKVRVLWNNQLI